MKENKAYKSSEIISKNQNFKGELEQLKIEFFQIISLISINLRKN